jgi:hypothetical protein
LKKRLIVLGAILILALTIIGLSAKSARAEDAVGPKVIGINATCKNWSQVEAIFTVLNPVDGATVPVDVIYTDGNLPGGEYRSITNNEEFTTQAGVTEYTLILNGMAPWYPGKNPRLKVMAQSFDTTHKVTKWFTVCGWPKPTEWRCYPNYWDQYYWDSKCWEKPKKCKPGKNWKFQPWPCPNN